MVFVRDSRDPGILNYDTIATDVTSVGPVSKKIIARAAVVYMDNNLAVFFTCYETLFGIYTVSNKNFYVVSRDRSFDSLRNFSVVLGPLTKLSVDLNHIYFTSNEPSCTN